MSFGGHVFDMIRRDKLNRELRSLRRERSKERLSKLYGKHSFEPEEVSVEELEKIGRQLKEWKAERQAHLSKQTLLFYALLLGGILVAWLVWSFLL